MNDKRYSKRFIDTQKCNFIDTVYINRHITGILIIEAEARGNLDSGW